MGTRPVDLVLDDGSRLNVVDHSNLERLREDAGRLGAFLGGGVGRDGAVVNLCVPRNGFYLAVGWVRQQRMRATLTLQDAAMFAEVSEEAGPLHA